MTLRPFQLERFYAEHEFSVPLQLSASDCETLSVGELLETVGASLPDLLDLRLGYTETRVGPSPGRPSRSTTPVAPPRTSSSATRPRS